MHFSFELKHVPNKFLNLRERNFSRESKCETHDLESADHVMTRRLRRRGRTNQLKLYAARIGELVGEERLRLTLNRLIRRLILDILLPVGKFRPGFQF